jgi:hypothetical protein
VGRRHWFPADARVIHLLALGQFYDVVRA